MNLPGGMRAEVEVADGGSAGTLWDGRSNDTLQGEAGLNRWKPDAATDTSLVGLKEIKETKRE